MATRDRVRVVLFQIRETEDSKLVEQESFLRSAGLAPAQLVPFDVMREAPTPAALDGAAAVFIGGSRFSVFEPGVPNLDALVETVRVARERRLPIFGVCFGAQLLAHAFGGEVVRDESHREFGTFEIETSDEALTDLLLADAPMSFAAQCAHQDRIARLPSAAVLLASSAECPTQAFSFPGENIYGVQFHPERSRADYEKVLDMRLRDHASDKEEVEAIRPRLRETPEAEKIVAKFVDRVVLRGA